MNNIIYVKKCLGKDKIPIDVYKIRSMKVGSDKKLESVLSNGVDGLGKPIEDPRITSLGKFLRRYWIDEIPQIYNLVRGDLKLVGIRPRTEEIWKIYPLDLMEKSLSQKPGLFAIQYAYVGNFNFNDNIDQMYKYLEEWDDDPFNTDKKYFNKIVKNIILGKVRSR